MNNNYVYNIVNVPSNSFAPVSANNGTIMFEFGINGSMRKRIDSVQQKTEYYLFNAFDQMKAYSDNGETYGYYGYDDAGQRMYKMILNQSVLQTNTQGNKILEVEKLMLSPNGYINIDQHGNYTKHYYADDQRIASKIGNEFNSSINYITDTMPLFIMKTELSELTNETVAYIEHNFNPITTLQGDAPQNYEDALFFYHGNHLSSTMMVTDISGAVTQSVLYAPFGKVILKYNQYWNQDKIPEYLFNACEYDEENKMYYMLNRYYSDEDVVFRGRDKLFEKYFWMSPYHYCFNNPLRFIDPTGLSPEDPGEEKGNPPKGNENKPPIVVVLPETKVDNFPQQQLPRETQSIPDEGGWGIHFTGGEGQSDRKGNGNNRSVDIKYLMKVIAKAGAAAKMFKPEELLDAVGFLNDLLQAGTEVGEAVDKTIGYITEKTKSKLDPNEKVSVPFTRHEKSGEVWQGKQTGVPRKDSARVSKELNERGR